MINCYNWQVIDLLKIPMTEFFNDNPDDIIKYANLFAEAFGNIISIRKVEIAKLGNLLCIKFNSNSLI